MNHDNAEPFSWLTVFNTYFIRNEAKIYMKLIKSITENEGGPCTSTMSRRTTMTRKQKGIL